MPDPLELRPLQVSDAPAMVEVLADPALYTFTGGEPPTLEALTRRYTAQTHGGPADGSERWLNWVVLAGPERRPVGYVQATVPVSNPDGATEVAWVIGAPWQGRGYAGRAARLMVHELAAAGVRSLVAHLHPEHAASAAVARRIRLHPTDVLVDGEVRWEGGVSASGLPGADHQPARPAGSGEPGIQGEDGGVALQGQLQRGHEVQGQA